MKIVSQTSQEIKIENNKGNWQANLTFFLVNFTIFPVLPLVFFIGIILPSASQIGVTSIICDRIEPKQVDCQISQSKFFDLVKQKTFSAKFVQSVKYIEVREKDKSDDEISFIYELSFASQLGETTRFETSRDSAYKIAQSVNSFLATQQPSFKYVVDDRRSFAVVVIVFMILFNFGIAFVCFKLLLFILQNTTEQEILLDKKYMQIKHTTKKFMIGTTIDDYKFADVIKIDALYATDSYENVSFKPRISMSSGKEYMLDMMSDRQAAIKLVNNLNQFIGLPEEEDPIVKK